MTKREDVPVTPCKTHTRTVRTQTKHGEVKTQVRIPMTHERRWRFKDTGKS